MASASDDFRANVKRATESFVDDERLARLLDDELLNRVIDETLLADSGSDEQTAECLGLLRKVAARHPAAPFAFEPVAVEMVQAVVGPLYRKLVGSEEAWRAMTQGIAQTLVDDPRSRCRLESLWRRLNEAEQ